MASEMSLTPWGVRIVDLLGGRPRAWLAREADLGARTLSDIIHKTTPAADKAVRIAQALGVTVEWLMTGEDREEEVVTGDVMREAGLAYPSPPPFDVSAVAVRYQQALQQLEEATQAAGVIPDEALRQVLISLLFKHRVPVEDIAMILAAKASR